MSDKVYEQLQMIRDKKTAFYNEQINNLNRTPKIPVIKPNVTRKYTSGSARLREVSKELILG